MKSVFYEYAFLQVLFSSSHNVIHYPYREGLYYMIIMTINFTPKNIHGFCNHSIKVKSDWWLPSNKV